MKTKKPKPDGLSINQCAIWDCMTLSEHSLSSISKRSGYSEQGIKNWMFGVFEPQQSAVNDIIDAVDMLRAENPKYVDWNIRKDELIRLKIEQKTSRQIAKIIGTTIPSIEHAAARFCKPSTHPTT
jgi:hypothetical protein